MSSLHHPFELTKISPQLSVHPAQRSSVSAKIPSYLSDNSLLNGIAICVNEESTTCPSANLYPFDEYAQLRQVRVKFHRTTTYLLSQSCSIFANDLFSRPVTNPDTWILFLSSGELIFLQGEFIFGTTWIRFRHWVNLLSGKSVLPERYLHDHELCRNLYDDFLFYAAFEFTSCKVSHLTFVFRHFWFLSHDFWYQNTIIRNCLVEQHAIECGTFNFSVYVFFSLGFMQNQCQL